MGLENCIITPMNNTIRISEIRLIEHDENFCDGKQTEKDLTFCNDFCSIRARNLDFVCSEGFKK